MLTITPLFEHPEVIADLATAHYKEWRHIYPNDSAVSFAEDLKRPTSQLSVPRAWVIIEKDAAIASAMIHEADLETDVTNGPWLSSVWVHPDYRGRGLAKALIAHAVEHAKQSNLMPLYLFTEKQELMYQHMGWQTIYNSTLHGHPIVVMKRD
jgi:N-acetylglutamate synthase-like GNAT family acetyltransferase